MQWKFYIKFIKPVNEVPIHRTCIYYYKATLRLASYHSNGTSHTEGIDVSDLGEDSHSDKTLNFTQKPLTTFLWADYLHSLVLEMELIQYLHRPLFPTKVCFTV